MGDSLKLWKSAQELTDAGISFVVVTLVGARGSTPQDPGAKIIVTRDGLHSGTIGGGKVENACIQKALEILEATQQAEPLYLTWNLQRDIGMSCGGETSFLFEHFYQNQWPIIIFGAGHVAQALTRVLSKLQCHVTVIDPRIEWIDKLSDVLGIVHPNPKELIAKLHPKSFFLCMTMGHALDFEILLEIAKIAPSAPYIGCIGSDIKALKIRKELRDSKVPEEFVERLHIPMGNRFGSNNPEEIAISIVSEILKVRDLFYQINLD
jgi:xanthine dehydrogenase accessory factor